MWTTAYSLIQLMQIHKFLFTKIVNNPSRTPRCTYDIKEHGNILDRRRLG